LKLVLPKASIIGFYLDFLETLADFDPLVDVVQEVLVFTFHLRFVNSLNVLFLFIFLINTKTSYKSCYFWPSAR